MASDSKHQDPTFDTTTSASSNTCGMATPQTPSECSEYSKCPQTPECPKLLECPQPRDCPKCAECPECPKCPKCPKCPWSEHGTIPRPGSTYHIIEKQSGKAITVMEDDVKLRNLIFPGLYRSHWQCVWHNGYFGFQNVMTGAYLGHDGRSGIRTTALDVSDWELWTPREHPDGGYELLTPYYWHTLMVLSVQGDESTLVRRRHGTTLWEFVEV
ncbi:hypothetical protein KVR01_007518 [Diaporthe batatas]|uniref:uncharacterized protein n=1 Tax=Diaporthe batatas TaxID=748121 RepID=UPI001D04FD92|nr:uncharacterized protein KVR01_007518 [Diaporthe batatas]KAG8163040.1 hypothetical protein KVR01_007518 [Diaporthe batatas]